MKPHLVCLAHDFDLLIQAQFSEDDGLSAHVAFTDRLAELGITVVDDLPVVRREVMLGSVGVPALSGLKGESVACEARAGGGGLRAECG